MWSDCAVARDTAEVSRVTHRWSVQVSWLGPAVNFSPNLNTWYTFGWPCLEIVFMFTSTTNASSHHIEDTDALWSEGGSVVGRWMAAGRV